MAFSWGAFDHLQDEDLAAAVARQEIQNRQGLGIARGFQDQRTALANEEIKRDTLESNAEYRREMLADRELRANAEIEERASRNAKRQADADETKRQQVWADSVLADQNSPPDAKRAAMAIKAGATPSISVSEAPSMLPVFRAPLKGPIEQIGEAPKGAHFVNEAAPRAAAAPREDRLIPVQTVEKGQPVTKYLPESEVRGQTFAKPSTGAGPTLTAPMRKALVDADVAGSLLGELKAQFDAGAKNVIGPMEGRARAFGQTTGLNVNKQFAQFSAATARLKNATIQAITGAAMGVEEAKRIIAEIPSETDHPDVWPIKYAQAVKNLGYLRNAINAQAGGTTTGTAQELTGADVEYDWTPNGLVPRGGG
jgi:hypothetical protein